ncbi:MAG: hypothetical protein ACRAVC_10515 [Trichormus sp.]
MLSPAEFSVKAGDGSHQDNSGKLAVKLALMLSFWVVNFQCQIGALTLEATVRH